MTRTRVWKYCQRLHRRVENQNFRGLIATWLKVTQSHYRQVAEINARQRTKRIRTLILATVPVYCLFHSFARVELSIFQALCF